jgi:hypothetical protein
MARGVMISRRSLVHGAIRSFEQNGILRAFPNLPHREKFLTMLPALQIAHFTVFSSLFTNFA